MVDRTGQQIGEYHLTRQVGAGTYGTVYQANHERLDWSPYQAESLPPANSIDQQSTHQVAVKIFHVELSPELQAHFPNEVQALRLQHPRIIPLHTSGFTGNTPYIVMDYVPQGSLRQRYPLGHRLPLSQVINYVQQIAEALQFAHERGIVHRDLKPQNILLRHNDEVVLSDFGVGVILHSAGPLTRFELAESVPYAAPELLQGRPQPASDQYALAVMAYEWICGVRPFTGSQESIIAQHQSMPPSPLRVYEPSIPPAVEAVILRALAKDPLARYPTVRDFALALHQAIQPAGVYAPGQYSYPGYSNPGYGAYAGAGTGQVAMMYPPTARPSFKIPPHMLSWSSGVALIGGALLSMLGLILLRFPQPSVDAGLPINIAGMFIIAVGLLMLALRFAGRSRALVIAALIVFVVPLIGYTAVVLYAPSFFAQMSEFVFPPQEINEIAFTFLLTDTVLLILSFAGLIFAGAGILVNTKGLLPYWTSLIGWGLIAANGLYALFRVLTILPWLQNNQTLDTVIANVILVLFFLINVLLLFLGSALITLQEAPVVQQASQAPTNV